MSGANGTDPIAALTAKVDQLAGIVAAMQPSEFPVDSYKDAARHLRRPFSPNAVKWKVQTTYKSGKGALVVPYIDARLVYERLNLVCPHLWHPKPRYENGHLWCDLTIDGITRPDIGDGYEGKGLWSDAVKRAAVPFGVGVSLYATPKQQLWANTPHIEITDSGRTDKKGNKIWFADITEQGYAHLAQIYEKWLSETGRDTFGEPLDHGDVVDSVGYLEGSGDLPADVIGAAPPDMVDAVFAGVDHLGLDGDGLNLILGTLGIDAIDGEMRAGVEKLSIDDAAKLLADLRKEAKKRKQAETPAEATTIDQGTIDSLMVGVEHLGLDVDGVSEVLRGLNRLPLDPLPMRAALAQLDPGSAEALLNALQRKADEAAAEPAPATTGEAATDAA